MKSLQKTAVPPDSAQAANYDAWNRLYAAPSPAVLACVARIVQEYAATLAASFYDSLLADEQAGRLLSHDLVAQRLDGALQNWLLALFATPDEVDVPALVAMQQRVGEVHARLAVSVPLVSRGARILKDQIGTYLRASDLGREDLSWAHQYVGGLFDLALEVMSTAYLQDTRRGVRADEAYRLFSLGQNVAAERERQRAALLEWSQAILFCTPLHGQQVALPVLRSSDFGLWMYHKGSAMFDGTAELPAILASMTALDSSVLPSLAGAIAAGNTALIASEIQVFQHKIDDIKYLLMTLFDRVAEVDGGRDPMTQLLNRRFLSTVLAREIALANSGHSTFSVFLADVDHFKQVNDRYGHAGGDTVLRQVAELLQDSCRAGDYLFRYGGEEFLVVLVDAGVQVLEQLAEKLRAAVQQHRFRLPNGDTHAVTISVGAAAFDGHPDPERLVDRADKALYAAKRAGRNNCQLG